MDYDNPTISARAPAYALESDDSESDWDEDVSPRESRNKKQLAPAVKVAIEGSVRKGHSVIFLVGEAGERIARGSGTGTDGAKVTVNGEQVGLVELVSSTILVFLSTAVPLASLHPLVSTLVRELSPSASTIITSYHSPSYLTSTPPNSAQILYLASTSTPELNSLRASAAVAPYSPPNLLHGLPASLLTLTSLAGNSSLLLLLPSTAPPQPLNGPFSHTVGWSSRNTSYDAGGPTGLSDPNQSFRDVHSSLLSLKNILRWEWWKPEGRDGNGFAWLDALRKARAKEQISSMYM